MSTTESRRRPRRIAALIALLVASGLLFSMLASSSASASPYCGGQTLSNYGICYGAARNLSAVSGYGVSRSVCVGIAPISPSCSAGPGHLASWSLGYVIHSSPYIQVNAPGATVVWGTAI